MERSSLPKFIILRGPSGAGKSTVGKRLRLEATHPIVLIEQDYYKEKMMRKQDDIKALMLEMQEADILIALKHGFDVIFEGILGKTSYLEIFQRIWGKNISENYMFYFDISFEETVKRHAMRPQANEFTIEDMKKWRKYAKKTGLDIERLIPEDKSLEDTVEYIKKVTRL